MKFKYIAKKITGEEKKGTIEAKDRFDLARLLRQQEYILISCESETEKKRFNFSFPWLNKVSIAEKIIFSRNLGVMIAAGLSIIKSLDILSRQTKNKKFRNILISIMSSVQKGNSLSDSMKKYPNVFHGLFIAMIKVGEESGKLSESLDMIAQQMDRNYSLRKKVRGAMIYPCIIMITMILIGILMMIYVVPSLLSTFEELGIDLPLSTQIIVFISNFLTGHKLLFFVSLLAFIILFTWSIRTERGKKVIETISLKTPIISSLVKKINSARTSRTLASLLNSGVNILEALDITKDVIQNSHYKKVIEKAKVDIQKGSPISEAFKQSTNLYTVLFGEMLAVGEETGKLPDMLSRIADFYEEEVSDITNNMASIIEPFLMIIIGIFVGFFAISMIKPMYSMMGGI